MAQQGSRQRTAYVAVVFAGLASLATSISDRGLGNEEVLLEGTLLVTQNATANQRFRVRTTGPWTLVVADLWVDEDEGAEMQAALVPDEPRLFATTANSSLVGLTPKPGARLVLAQPPCALADQCEPTETGGLPDYAFALALDGGAVDVAVHYRIVVNTIAASNKDDFGLELLAE